MRSLVLFMLLSLSITAKAQENDTVFIKNNKFQKIFIDQNKNSDYYRSISDFTGFNILGNASKVKDKLLHSKWIQIQIYKGEYFLYYPCDQINDLKYAINNSRIQIKNSEVVTYTIISVKRKKKNIYIKYQEPNSQHQILLEIIPVEQKNGIYKFITYNGNQQNEKIMLQSDKYKNYKMIVNECTENKSSELNFEH